tara:strand:- start:61 stop:498 length:438 start_codon:yes stop_codon:yes gene_type:complete
MNLELARVTDKPQLWQDSDPIHPNLAPDFKTAEGREVMGLKGGDGSWKAFMCYARTTEVPRSIEELVQLTHPKGEVVVPYTVWSFEKGAGREIVNQILDMARGESGVLRVVTLSPQTEMALRFHSRNGAHVMRVNSETINYEYPV